nr:MAG: hypothetical protein [Locarnavirus sp.]
MVTINEFTMLNCQDMQNPQPKENSLVDLQEEMYLHDKMYLEKNHHLREYMNAYKDVVIKSGAVKHKDLAHTKHNLMQRMFKRMRRDYRYMIGARQGIVPTNSGLSRVSEGDWERDLTRECVESNPGPQFQICSDLYMIDTTPTLSRELYAINEDEVITGKGIFEYCHNCDTLSKILDYSKQLVFYRCSCKECEFAAQSFLGDLTINEYQARFSRWINDGEHLGRSFLGRHLNITGKYDAQINLIEDVGLLFFHFVRSRNNTDRCVALINFCKLRGMAISFVGTLLEISDSLFKPQLDNLSEEELSRAMGFTAQGEEDSVENGFAQIRGALNTYDKLKELPIYKKMHKFFLYLLCNGLLNGTNITFKSLQFDKFEEESLKRAHKPGFDMVHAMLDTVVFVCEAGYDYFKTGSFDKFIHSGSSYDKWLTTAQKLKLQSKFLSNPEPHGINRFSFVSELKDAIEKGKAIVKFTGGLDKGEKLFLQRTLMELQLIESEETTRRSAQQPRKDPFGILIHGSSHIAKSKLTEIMFKHYGKCFNLPIDDSYRYTRCPTDEYWSGFDSTQWCIVMDDIAFLAPTGEVDPTLKELLQVKNSVPYTPPQAALEDKGRTPVKAELLIATTNTKHLNLHAYFACPFAIARRLSFVVTPTVKEQYVKNGFMVDSKKIPPTPEGEYMDIWNFEVSVPMPESTIAKDNQRTRYEKIETFEDIHSFLQWYIYVAEEHAAAQAKADKAARTMAEVKVCMGCKRVESQCLCNTAWEHRYAKCGVCELTIGNCSCSEQVSVADFNKVYQLKLWAYTKILQGERFDFDDYEEDVLAWKWYAILWYVIMSYYSFYLTLIFVASVGLTYSFIRHLPQLLHFFYQYRYGYLWKYRMLFSICGNEADTWRLIFRVCGEKASKIKVKQNHLYGLGLVLALPATLLSMRSLWRMYIAETEFQKEMEHPPLSVDECKTRGMLVYDEEKVKTPRGEYLVMKKPESTSKTQDVRSIPDLSVFEDMEVETPEGRFTVMRVQGYDVQGNEGSIPKPLVMEKPTFYYHDPYAVTECVISGASKCSQGDILENLISNNTAAFHLRFPALGRGMHTTGVNIHGNLWLLNKHSVKAECGNLDVIYDDTEKNVSKNVRDVAFSSADFIEIPDSDAILIQLRCIPPGRSLLQYFPLDPLLKGRYKGKYIMRSRCGTVSQLQVDNIHKGSCPVFGVPGYFGIAVRPTQVGDCGSLCVVEVGEGKVIFGSHTSGAPNGGICMQHLSQKMLNDAINQFEPQVHEGVLPISAPGYDRVLMKDLHPKSCIRFLENGTAKVYGSFSGYRPKHKSHVEPNYICDYVTQHGYKADFGPPKMDWQPWHLAIKDMTTPVHCYLNENIRKCEDAFFNDIVSKLGDKLSMLEVYTMDVALNGVPGVTYVDKLNSRTSAGNPFKKSKEHFITEDEFGRIVSVDQIILDRVADIEACYDANTRYHPQFCGHLKDEPVSLKKIASGKTRVFTGGEFAWSIVVRKYLLSHIRLIQNNTFVFEAMPGVVAQSTEWRDLYNYLTVFGKDRMIAGDYGKFDKRMAAPFILSAFNILERLAKASGWPDEDLRYIRCIAQDTAFPCIDFNGDLIEIQGNPSGHPLTVIINCLVNSLYMRYAYLLISGKPLESFQDNVKLATYGDDNIMGVSLDCPNFNHTRIAMAMKCIGVDYTMAEKEAESVPFIHIDDTTFLKRAFRFDSDIGCIVAPLDESSFHKMLTARLPKDDMAAEAHAMNVIETAQREYFFHGKEIFEEKQKFFRQLVEDCGLKSWVQNSTFPNYYDMVYDFWMKYNDVENALKFSLREHTPQSLVVDAIPLVCEETTLNRSEVLSAEGMYELIGQTFLGRGLRVKSVCCTLAPEHVSVPNPVCSVSSSSSEDDEEYNRYKGVGFHLWQSQSAEIVSDDTQHDTEEVKQGLVTFLEHREIDPVGLPSNSILMNSTMNTDISKFLSRPVKIRVVTWSESDTGLLDNFDPWNLWATTTSVQSKLANYSYIRGDLKLKIQISASPFYYGLILANYRPLTAFKIDTINHGSTDVWKIEQSQRPHVKIDPSNGDTFEITLPFIYPWNMLPLKNASDFTDMGNFRFDIYSVLRSANGVTSAGVTLSVFAWMDNIVLSGATAGYAAQSDEYGTGIVSKPASWVANIAGRLQSMPVIGRFATATRIGASAVGAIASLFGFTNVPVISDAQPFRSEPFPKLASAEIGYPVEKLTLDPKNELSIDPRILGMPDGVDELSIPHIVQRESYLCLSNWSTADTAGTIKFSCLVKPSLCDVESASGSAGIGYHLTPMAWARLLFSHWRGDIIITLRVVASKYHKGKLKISYDPTSYGTGVNSILTSDSTTNTVQTSILDIGENREVEFTIPYQQALQFLLNSEGSGDWSTSSTPTLTHNNTQDNGIFCVRVQNALTAPVLSSSVDILVFLRAGENFELAGAREMNTAHTWSYFAPQSDEYICTPINGKVQLGTVSSDTSNEYLVHFGEQVVSLRTLLHRYNKLTSEQVVPSAVANTYQAVEKIVGRLPLHPGYTSSGYSTAKKQTLPGSYGYNYANMTTLSFISNAYLGYRGATNYTFNVSSNTPMSDVRAFRALNGLAAVNSTTSVIASTSQFAKAAVSVAGGGGSALINQRTQSGLNVAFPMFTQYKFLSTNPSCGNVPGTGDPEMLSLQFALPYPTTTVTDSVILNTYIAAAPDFTLMYFVNTPTLWVYTNFPDAA